METLSQWIDAGAKLCGSQNALATRMGTDSGTLANAKAGRRAMSMPMLRRLGEVCGVDPWALYVLQAKEREAIREGRKDPGGKDTLTTTNQGDKDSVTGTLSQKKSMQDNDLEQRSATSRSAHYRGLVRLGSLGTRAIMGLQDWSQTAQSIGMAMRLVAPARTMIQPC